MTSLITDFVTEIIVKELWEPMKRHVGYFVCCEKYVHGLSNRVKDLEPIKKDRQTIKNQARSRGEEPSNELEDWLKKVEEVEADANIIADKIGEHKGCFTCLSYLGSRYSLGKEATNKKAKVDELMRKKLENMCLPVPIPSFEFLPIGDFRVFESTKSAVNKVVHALGNDEIHMIGVYGTGGVGKTTLSKEVMRHAKINNMFDEVVMVTVSQNPSMESIQEKMAQGLGINCNQKNSTIDRLIHGRIIDLNKLLIVFDDIWETLDLAEVGIPQDSKHCKILLTSRSLEICNAMRVQQKISLEVLSPEDSWELFKENSGAAESCVARNVASECGGLPLAIVTVGRALFGKSQDDWEFVLGRLRAAVPDSILGLENVYNQLKVSYDMLRSEEAKLCFLLCSMFKEDAEIDVEDLTMYAMGERFLKDVHTVQEARKCVKFLVNKLKASCLLLEGKNEGLVKMHDVVRDVAIYIASNKKEGCLSIFCSGNQCWNESESLKECRRLSILGNYNDTILPEQPPECSQIQTLVLEEIKNIPDNFFEKMTSLRVLHLRNIRMLSLPASMSHLMNLRTLLIDYCYELNDIFILGGQKNLEVLRLVTTALNELPESIGKLINLKYLAPLYPRGWIEHIRIPPKVISNMSQLEEFHMDRCVTPWEVTGGAPGKSSPLDEILVLTKLVALTIRLGDTECLDATRHMEFKGNLERFSIHVSKNTSLPLKFLRSMLLELWGLHLPGWSIMLLGKTDALSLKGSVCSHLDVTGCGGGSGFECLKYLDLESCDEMEFVIHGSVVPGVILFPNLEKLFLTSMKKLTGLCRGPLPLGSLERLRVLEADECPNLNIEPILHMEFLIHSSTSEAGVHNIILPDLQKLILSCMEKLIGICSGPLLPGSLQKLRALNIYSCPKFNINGVIHIADNMEELDISGENSMRELFSNNDCMVTGEIWVGEYCGHALLPSLKTLHLYHLHELVCIWKRGSMPPPVGSLSNLKEINVSVCNKLRYLLTPTLAQRLERLEVIHIQQCEGIEGLISLEDEEEEGEPSSISLSKSVAPSSPIFCNLRIFEIIHCPGFCTPFPMGLAQSLVRLEKLQISMCFRMEAIILRGEEEVEFDNLFPSLVQIELHDLPKLTSFFSDGGSLTSTALLLPSLERITIQHCPQLTKLPLGPQSSPNLKEIWGSRKEWLEGLVWDDENSRSRFQPLLQHDQKRIHQKKKKKIKNVSSLFASAFMHACCVLRHYL
ncbi:Disease resistance protein [Acorus gramineus]|uniref:Disease resistance protein n=1 Tax=Acorus gramineus TaxID=55184 RepID=A0AAV9BWF7_ACOGR|nr:Disease resistance protein [Acorus gramineus]